MHSTASYCQTIHHIHRGRIVTLHLPTASEKLRRTKLEWGDACCMMTPAFWAAQSWMWELEEPDHYRLGRSLEEELMACLLGGHGIPAEVGLAAYERLRGIWRSSPDRMEEASEVEALLSEPLTVNGRRVRYRFAAQKARYLSESLAQLQTIDVSLGDRDFRDALCTLKGVGPKTASWIVRNWRGSDDVAILDVHLLRAGRELGLFSSELSVERHYRMIEEAFVNFARDIGAKASILDSVIWMAVRTANHAKPALRPHTKSDVRQREIDLMLH